MRQMVFASALIAALALAGAALADREQVHLTETGQRAAHAAVLRRSDLGGNGWSGTKKTPVLNSSIGCPGFRPKQSDLVVVGAAEKVWKHGGIEHDSEAQVLKSAKMLRLDWVRTVRRPQVLRCLRRNVSRSLTAGERLSYVTRLPLPHVAALARLYRSVITVRANGKHTAVLVDALLIGVRRTEITLTTTALYSQRKAVTKAEIRLARILIRRSR